MNKASEKNYETDDVFARTKKNEAGQRSKGFDELQNIHFLLNVSILNL